MASTTPEGAYTSTSMEGNPYRPFDLCKLVLGAGGSYVARYSVTQPLSLMNAIKKSFSINGFTFIEVLSPCPTQFGRRNRFDSPADMLKLLMERCITREEAVALSENELRDKIITGEFSNG